MTRGRRGAEAGRLRATGDSYLLGGRKSKGGRKRKGKDGEDKSAEDKSAAAAKEEDPGGGDVFGSVDADDPEAASKLMTKVTPKDRVRFALKQVDSDGYWAVISSGIVFGTFLLESYNMSSFGGWDVLYRDDIKWYTGLISMQDLIDIEDAYNLLFFFEFCLRAWAADFKKDFWTNPITVVDFLATIPPILAAIGLTDRASPLFRFLRLLRVLRLLRLLDRSPDSVLFGLVRSDSMGIQLVGIGAEFICIFVIAAGVIYDLEYEVNPAVNNLNDTLYWAILTLTGIGQPFEVVTAGGRVATVLSIAVALIVVPGQLAKLATVAGAQNLMGMMEMEDDNDDDEYNDGDPMVSADWEEVGAWGLSPGASMGGGFAAMAGPGGFGLGAMTGVQGMMSGAGTPASKGPYSGASTSRAALSSAAGGSSTSMSREPLGESPAVYPPEGGGSVPVAVGDGRTLAMRPKVWDGRECDQCGLQIHESDARFCRRCGSRLGLESAGTLYVRRRSTEKDSAAEMKRKRERKEKLVGSRPLAFRPANQTAAIASGKAAMAIGRMGIDKVAEMREKKKRAGEKKQEDGEDGAPPPRPAN